MYSLAYSTPLLAENNPLQMQHEAALNDATVNYKNAKSDFDKRYALLEKAVALDSLKRSDEALQIIDEAISKDAESLYLVETKAKILFSLNKLDEALSILDPVISKTRLEASTQSSINQFATLANFSEGFLTATLVRIQREQWVEALSTLKDAKSIFGGASFGGYKAMLYQYILMRAKFDADISPELAQNVKAYEDFPKTYYGLIIKSLKGKDVKSDFMKYISKLPPAEKQDALAEWLFYEGAYKKYAMADNASALKNLEELNKLAPYGNIEWINATRLFVSQEQ